MKKTSDYSEPSASILTSIKYPAFDVDIHLKGEYSAKKNRKLHKHEALINFEAKNNPQLNTKIVGELSETRSNQVDVQTNVDIWYGPDFQNNAKHIVFRMDMKETSDYREQSASILTSIKYPALDVDIQLKGECVEKKINSKLQKLEAIIDFEARNNPELNTKIVGELSEIRSNQEYVQTNVDLWYGPDFQNDAKHIVLRLDMKKTSDYREPSASILTSIKYPALDVDIHLKGEYAAKENRTLHKHEALINFESRNNPELNTKIVGELSGNQVDVQTNIDIWYGPDFQNDAKHIVLSLDMKKMSDYRESSASILTSIKYPAIDVDIHFGGDYVCENSKIWSSLVLHSGQRKPIKTSFRVDVKGKWRFTNINVAEYILIVPQHSIDEYFIYSAERTLERNFKTTLKVRLKRGENNEITSLIIPSTDTFTIIIDIKLFGQSLANMKLEFKEREKIYSARMSFESSHRKYESYMTLLLHDYLPPSEHLTGYIAVIFPTRIVIFDIFYVFSGKGSSYESFKLDIVKKYDSAKNIFKTNNGVDITSKISTPLKELSRLAFDASILKTRGRIVTDTFVFRFDPSRAYKLRPIVTTIEINEESGIKLSNEYNIGPNKKYFELRANVRNIVNLNVFYKCPTSGLYAVAYKHTGNFKDFQCHLEFTKNTEEWHGDFHLKTVGSIRGGMLKFKPPASSRLNPVLVSLEHTGDLNDFTCHVQFTKSTEEWNGDFYLKTVGSIQGMLKFKPSASSRLKPVSVSLEHTGDLNDFKCHVDLTENFEEWHGDFHLKKDENIKGMLKLKPPSSSTFKPILISFEHSWIKMISRTDVLIGEDKIAYKLVCSLAPIFWHFDFQFGKIYMNTDFVLKIKSISVGLSFRITSSLCSDATGDFYIQGELTDFSSTTVLEISNNENDEHLVYRTISSSIDSPTKIESAIEKLGLTVQRHGDIARSYTVKRSRSALLQITSERYTVTFRFWSKKSINFDGSITSPIEGYKSLTANFKQSNNKRYFKCTGSAVIEHERSDFNIKLDRYIPKLLAKATIKHNYEYSILVDLKKDINAKFDMVIPDMDHISGNYTQSLSSHSCKALAHLKLSSSVFFDCDIELKWKTDLIVVFTLKTPFQGFEKIVLKTNYDRSLSTKTYTSSANLQIEEYVVEVSTTIVDTPSLTNADFTLRTRGELMHSSARSHNDIRASFMQSGSSSGTVMTYEVNINSLTRINGKLNTVHFGSEQMSADVELRTPFKNMEVNKVSYKHTRDSNNIQCDINSSIFGKEVTGTIAGSVQPLRMDLDIKTPFKDIENIGLNGIVETDENKYFGRMQAKLNPNNQFLIEGKLSTARSIDGAISISTPFKQMRNTSIMISDTNLVTRGVSEGVKIIHNGKRIGT
ncbi:uncharacterized protein LOC132719145 [Ruditapes philippinarum]|uniref:uncharacterized protein LOC132719145 n=1 Tax=Ruditapes philippinarum TaxID=129788 RepID=UPI00295AB270|nr:uncharacterized protein LOC132719145 [Ruditapes philippinarum]